MRRLLLALTVSLVPSLTAAQWPARAVDVGEVRLHYIVAGEGPAVILIHGWALSLREWHDQVAALSPSYRVVALDRRGFGRSTGFADLSADPGDVRVLLDTLGIRSAVLVGHSAGANVALRFAATFPSRVIALVLYGGPPPQGFPGIERDAEQIRRRQEIARQHGVDSVLRMAISQPQFRPGPGRTPAMAARLDSILSAYTGKDLTDARPPSDAFPPARLDVVRTWRFPVLLISGETEARRWHDMTDSLVRWMPDARKVVIPGGGHGVHFDEPRLFNEALLAFLRMATTR